MADQPKQNTEGSDVSEKELEKRIILRWIRYLARIVGAGCIVILIVVLIAWSYRTLPAEKRFLNSDLPQGGPTPAASYGSRMSPNDGMELVYVPEGEFSIGSEKYHDEQPVHTVYLDAYWIDRTEVTNAMYVQCVAEGACSEPLRLDSDTREIYYGSPDYADHPVIFVDWQRANTYCEWAGRRLPTEAEWEKAAGGTDGRSYPWGEETGCKLANVDATWYISDCIGDTISVGSYPEGASPYGTLDMAGNVYEWVSDWYNGSYYSQSPERNPIGPDCDCGDKRVVRGGSWEDPKSLSTTTNRGARTPRWIFKDVGFRCAISADIESAD